MQPGCDTMKVLSLGWGVQSFTIAAMIALGELEPIDFAIHADTLHESQLTYEFIARWSPWLEDHNLSIKTVKNPTGGVFQILKKPGQIQAPFFTLDKQGNPVLLEEIEDKNGDKIIVPTGNVFRFQNMIIESKDEKGKPVFKTLNDLDSLFWNGIINLGAGNTLVESQQKELNSFITDFINYEISETKKNIN